MRLLVQAQSAPLGKAVFNAFKNDLTAQDQLVLSTEMARSGVPNQAFVRSPIRNSGPAFLLYYSPSFLRAASSEAPVAALHIIAELYRQARSMWPLTEEDAGRSVTIRIDQIKEKTVADIAAVHKKDQAWFLFKRSSHEACVELHPIYSMNTFSATGAEFRLLALWAPGGSEAVERDDNFLIYELEQIIDRQAVSAADYVL